MQRDVYVYAGREIKLFRNGSTHTYTHVAVVEWGEREKVEQNEYEMVHGAHDPVDCIMFLWNSRDVRLKRDLTSENCHSHLHKCKPMSGDHEIPVSRQINFRRLLRRYFVNLSCERSERL